MAYQKQDKNLAIKIRKVLQIGSSSYICIPPEFVRFHGIKKGDRLPVMTANSVMKVVVMDK